MVLTGELRLYHEIAEGAGVSPADGYFLVQQAPENFSEPVWSKIHCALHLCLQGLCVKKLELVFPVVKRSFNIIMKRTA